MIPGIGISASASKPADPTGKYVLYGTRPGYVLSTNSGVSFPATSVNAFPKGIDVSSSYTGQYMLSTSNSKVSSDYGATWTAITTQYSLGDTYGSAVSYSGQYMVFAVYSGSVYSSNDYGATWSTWVVPSPWTSVVWCNRNGSGSNILCVDGTNILRSTNSGSTWSTINTTYGFSKVFSGGGTTTYALKCNGTDSYLYESTTDGTYWSLKCTFLGRYVSNGSCNPDGSKICLVFYNTVGHTRDNIAYSSNSGSSFAFTTADEDFDGKGSYTSFDGNTMLALSTAGYLYKSTNGWSSFTKTQMPSGTSSGIVGTANTSNTIVVVGASYVKRSTDYTNYSDVFIYYDNQSFSYADMSEDTSTMLISANSPYRCLVSRDKGSTWYTAAQYYKVMSATGQYMLGGLSTSNLYVSTNYGVSNTNRGTSAAHTQLFVSYSGELMVSIADTNMYRSINYGTTWVTSAIGITAGKFVVSDTAGYALAIASSPTASYIRQSTNLSATTPTWANKSTSLARTGIAASKTMQYCICTLDNNQVYIQRSTDYGSTWANVTVSATSSSRKFPFVNTLGDIMYSYEISSYKLYKSSDYGANWSLAYTVSVPATDIAYTRSGKTIIINTGTAFVVSSNYGVTFTPTSYTIAPLSNIDIES